MSKFKGSRNMKSSTALLLCAYAALTPNNILAYDAKVDLSALQSMNPSIFEPGNCRLDKVNDLFFSFACGEATNPVISVLGGVTSKPTIEFAVSPDIEARCVSLGNCLNAEPFVYKEWTGGRYLIDGKFGFVSHTVLVSGDAVIEITSRDLERSVAEKNAAIALEQVGAILLCIPWAGTNATCPAQK